LLAASVSSVSMISASPSKASSTRVVSSANQYQIVAGHLKKNQVQPRGAMQRTHRRVSRRR
jgi:hypothetical protein